MEGLNQSLFIVWWHEGNFWGSKSALIWPGAALNLPCFLARIIWKKWTLLKLWISQYFNDCCLPVIRMKHSHRISFSLTSTYCTLIWVFHLLSLNSVRIYGKFTVHLLHWMLCVPLPDCGACCSRSDCFTGGTARCPNICCTCCWSRLRGNRGNY